jgi:methionyl aminopeptidase
LIRAACKIGRDALDAGHRIIAPGVTTEEIDKVVHEYIISQGAYPSPLGYYNFPRSCCTSVNEIICHGIPDTRPLEEGDIINLDISCYKDGVHADLNETFCVGKVSESSRALIEATYESLMLCIEQCKPGTMYREMGNIISGHVEPKGYSVVRSYQGHGVGRMFHQAPSVPHYSKNKAVGFMKPGHIFTIEPMINMGVWKDITWNDKWTSATADGQRSAQFEHTILITETGCEVLTARTKDSPPLEFMT